MLVVSEKIQFKEFDESAVIFNELSGRTFHVDLIAVEILTNIPSSGIQKTDLLHKLLSLYEVNEINIAQPYLDDTIERLIELDLISSSREYRRN